MRLKGVNRVQAVGSVSLVRLGTTSMAISALLALRNASHATQLAASLALFGTS